MANVLVVAALQFSDPVLFAVLVKADDSLLHEPQPLSDALPERKSKGGREWNPL